MKKCLSILMLFALCPGYVYGLATEKSLEEKISSELCQKLYDRFDFYYTHGYKKKYNLNIALYLEDISNIDGRHLQFDTIYLLYVHWKDDRVTDLLKEFGVYDADNAAWLCDWEPSVVWGKEKKLFDPVVRFENRKSRVNFHDNRADWVEIYTDGSIQMRVRDAATFRASFKLHNYPFDTQTLRYIITTEFGSRLVTMGPDTRMLDYLAQFQAGANNGTSLDVPEWKVTGAGYQINTFQQDGVDKQQFILEITVQRKVGSYIVKVILPLLFLFAVCWSAFWINPKEIDARTNITIVGFLALITYNIIVTDDLPKVDYTTLVDVFIFITYCFIGGATVLCILSHGLYLKSGKTSNFLDDYAKFVGPFAYILIVSSFVWYYFGLAHAG